MNFFWKGNTKLQENSPKKRHHDQPLDKDSIYLQQIQNYIDTAQGYEILRTKLIKQINVNNCYDSPLVMKIVKVLKWGFQTEDRKKIQRTIYITEDLVSHCTKIFSEAMNNRPFVQVLERIVIQTNYLTLSWGSWGQIKERICGLFLFWHEKYKNEEQQRICCYVYQKLRKTDALFPSRPFIEEVPYVEEVALSKQEVEKKKQQQTVKVEQHLKEINKIIEEGNELFKNKKMTTQFVRVLKAKSKILYEISTTEGQKLGESEKQKIKVTYKKLRTLLKQTQKKNEEIIKKNKIQSQQNYLTNKLQTLQGKKKDEAQGQKHIDKNLLDISPSTKQQIKPNSNEQGKNNLLDILDNDNDQQEVKEVVKEEKKVQSIKLNLMEEKDEIVDTVNIGNNEQNLLDIGPSQKQSIDFKGLYNKAKDEEKPFGLDNLDYVSPEKQTQKKQQKQDEFCEFQTESPQKLNQTDQII